VVKAVVLAAGKGTRMRQLSDRRPKPLMPLANRPALALMVTRLAEAGADRVLIVVGHLGRQIRSCIGNGSRFGVRAEYVEQPRQMGTGAALMLAEEFAGSDPFFLTFGDCIAHAENYRRAVELFRAGAGAVLTTHDIGRRVGQGAVFPRDGRLQRIAERPAPGEDSPLVSAGLFVFPPRIFDCTRSLPPAPSGEHELTGGIQKLADGGCDVRVVPITGYWANLTSPDELIAANSNVHRELLERGEEVLAASARISPSAQLREAVAVAAGAAVGDGASLGPNVSVGEECSIGSGCKLESCILLEGVTVGPGAVIEHAVVEDGASIPAGAVQRSSKGHAAIIGKATCV